MVADSSNDLRGMVVSDSLGNALVRRALTLNCGLLISNCVAVFDEVVSGSPSNTITLSSTSGIRIVVYDLSGVSFPGHYSEKATGQQFTTLSATVASVSSGDLQICSYIQPVNSGVTLSFSSGDTIYDVGAPQVTTIAHTWAAVTGASTCTAANANTEDDAGVLFADYPGVVAAVPAPATTASPAAGPSGSPALAQAPAICAGTALCSLGQAPANGDVLSVMVADGSGDLRSMTVSDSLGNQLSRRALTINCGLLLAYCVAVYDEVVSGSPSNVLTLSSTNGYRIAVYDISAAAFPGRYAETGTDQLLTTLGTSLQSVGSGDLQVCSYISPVNSGASLSFSSGTAVGDVAGPLLAEVTHAWASAAGPSTCTAANADTDYSAGVLFADYTRGVAPIPSPTPVPSPSPSPSASPSPAPSPTAPPSSITYNATSSCINHALYTNNVLPSGVGEFTTNGLNRSYWGGTKSRTYAPTATWGPGFYPSWGRHQYDTYFGDSSDGIGLDPFNVTNDTAVAGSPQALSIMAEPMPSSVTSNNADMLTVLANDQWPVTSASAPFQVPSAGGTLVVNVANPSSAQNNWTVGMGYSGGAVMFVGTLTSGGATPSGNGTGGANPWTISNIRVYSGTPGTTITPGVNDEGGFRAYNWPQYYSGALDTNINLEYGFFVARVRVPNYLPALSPAFWTLETGGVASNSSGLERDEYDIQEMFGATAGNSMNAGNILWNTSSFWPKPTGLYAFPSGTPQSAYHDYGVLVTPGSTTFYLDGVPIAGHSGGPDWTQGSPDKEIMLMFQVGAPKSWLDPNALGAGNPWPQYYWAQWIRIFQPTTTAC